MYGISISNFIVNEEMRNKFSQFKCCKCSIIPFNPFIFYNDNNQVYLCEECLRNLLTNNESSIIKAFNNNKINSIKPLYDLVFKNVEFHCPINGKECIKKIKYEDLQNHIKECNNNKKQEKMLKFGNINEVIKDKENKLHPLTIEKYKTPENLYSIFENQLSELNKNFDLKISKIDKKIDKLIDNQLFLQEEFKFMSKKNSMCTICSQRGKREYCGICDFQYCRKCIVKCKICEKNVCLFCLRKNKNCKNECKNFLCERCYTCVFTDNKVLDNSKAEDYFYRSIICNKNKCVNCDLQISCHNCSKKCCSDCFKDCSLTLNNICNICYRKNKGNLGKIIDKFFPSEDSLDNIKYSHSILVGTNNGKIKHFNLENFSIIDRFFIHKDSIKSLKKKEDKIISCSSDSYLKVWENLNFTNPIFEYCDRQDKNMYNEISDSLWMTNNLILSSCINNNYCLLFNLTNKNIEHRLPILTPTTLCKLSESSVLIGTEWSKIVNWDVGSNTIKFELNAHNGTSVNNIINLPHYKQASTLSSGDDNNFRLWDLNTLENTLVINNCQCNSTLHEINDGRIVNGCSDSSVKIWDLNSKEHTVLKGHKDRVCDFLSFNEYYLLSCSFDHTLRLWDLRKNEMVYFHQFNNPLIKLMDIIL